MFTQVDFKDASGKTVQTVLMDFASFIVVFTDKTFSYVDVDNFHECVEIDTMAEFKAHWCSMDRALIPAFGEDAEPMFRESKAMDDLAKAALELESKEKRRREYESLKKEFGDSDAT